MSGIGFCLLKSYFHFSLISKFSSAMLCFYQDICIFLIFSKWEQGEGEGELEDEEE